MNTGNNRFIKKALTGKMPRDEQVAAIEEAGKRHYYTEEQEFDDISKKMVIDEMCRFIKPVRILELGYTNNIWTQALLQH